MILNTLENELDFHAPGVFFGDFQPATESIQRKLVRNEQVDLYPAALDQRQRLGKGLVDSKAGNDLEIVPEDFVGWELHEGSDRRYPENPDFSRDLA